MESKHTERPNKGSFAWGSWDIGGAKHWWSCPAFHLLTPGNFEPACITDTGSYRLREVQLHLIHKAPSPRLTRLDRPHDWVLRLMEVLRRMFTGRRIAAPHMPADHAHPQMNPPASNLQTLLAPRRRRFYIANLPQMSALHLSHRLPPEMQLHTNPKRKSKSERTHKSILHPLRNPILLQLPVERSLPDTQQPSRHQLVPLQLSNRPQNRLPLHLRDRDDPAISSLRSRSGGIRRFTTFSRKKRSLRNRPCSTIAARSRLVAASTRAEIGLACVDPTGLTSFSCSARSSFACRSSGSSPISSRNTVPPSAAANSPSFARSAPVNAPFTWPNSSLSISVGTSDPQSTGTNGFAAFGPLKWIDRATNSFPVPLSPRISTGCVENATFDKIRYSFSISGDCPTIPPTPFCDRSLSRSCRLSIS